MFLGRYQKHTQREDKYKNKKLPVKTVILDQSIITGIGNIYADEILFLFKKVKRNENENPKEIITLYTLIDLAAKSCPTLVTPWTVAC